MAVDTELKRASAMGFAHITRALLPPPQGASTAFQRAMGEYLYAGIAPEGYTPPLQRSGTMHQPSPRIWVNFWYPSG